LLLPRLDAARSKTAQTSERLVALERRIREGYRLVKEEESAVAALQEAAELSDMLFPHRDPGFASGMVARRRPASSEGGGGGEGEGDGGGSGGKETSGRGGGREGGLGPGEEGEGGGEGAWLHSLWRQLSAPRAAEDSAGKAAGGGGGGGGGGEVVSLEGGGGGGWQELNPRDTLLVREEIVRELEAYRQRRFRLRGVRQHDEATALLGEGRLGECEAKLEASNMSFARAALDERDRRGFARKAERLLLRVARCREQAAAGALLIKGAKACLEVFNLPQARAQLAQALKLFLDEGRIPRPLGAPYASEVEALMDSVAGMSKRGLEEAKAVEERARRALQVLK
jgi:hypothetical protein